MRILLIGATGTIGKAIAATLGSRHEVLLASRQQAPLRVDIADPASIRSLCAKVGKVGAVISAAGQARFKPFDELSDADFRFSVDNKLMGQVNLVRYGLASVVDGGSITITSGVLAQQPSRGSAAISLVNAGLEGFARAAALEAPRGIRINVVSPPWVTETLQALGMPLQGGLPAATVASLRRQRRGYGDRASYFPVGEPTDELATRRATARYAGSWRAGYRSAGAASAGGRLDCWADPPRCHPVSALAGRRIHLHGRRSHRRSRRRVARCGGGTGHGRDGTRRGYEGPALRHDGYRHGMVGGGRPRTQGGVQSPLSVHGHLGTAGRALADRRGARLPCAREVALHTARRSLGSIRQGAATNHGAYVPQAATRPARRHRSRDYRLRRTPGDHARGSHS